MDAQSLDTQRHFAIDFTGSLKNISIMRSIGIDNEFAPPLSEVFGRVLPREIVTSSSETCCRRIFMMKILL